MERSVKDTDLNTGKVKREHSSSSEQDKGLTLEFIDDRGREIANIIREPLDHVDQTR